MTKITYIRTKDNKIYLNDSTISELDIIAKGSTIFKVLKDDDLIESVYYESKMKSYQIGLNAFYEYKELHDTLPLPKEHIVKIYTKQGNNYILVWDNEKRRLINDKQTSNK